MYRTADHQQRACFLQVISPNNSALFLTKLPNLIQVSFSASILQLVSVLWIFRFALASQSFPKSWVSPTAGTALPAGGLGKWRNCFPGWYFEIQQFQDSIENSKILLSDNFTWTWKQKQCYQNAIRGLCLSVRVQKPLICGCRSMLVQNRASKKLQDRGTRN